MSQLKENGLILPLQLMKLISLIILGGYALFYFKEL